MSDIQQADEPKRRVHQGDAISGLSELPDNYAHATVVDYPWQFEIQNGTGRFEYRRLPGQGDGEGDRDISHEDAMFEMADDDAVVAVLSQLTRVLVDGAWMVFMADDRFQEVVRDAMRDVDGVILRRNWAWTPESMGMGYYGRIDHYPMPVATVGETDRYVSDRPTLFRISGGRQTDYPTGKPVELYRKLLAPPVIYDGETLLEPFCGTGPGAAVAAERGLSYWGADTNTEAVNKVQARLEQQRIGTDLDDFGGGGDA